MEQICFDASWVNRILGYLVGGAFNMMIFYAGWWWGRRMARSVGPSEKKK